MTAKRILHLVAFAVGYPALAVLVVIVAMWAGMDVAEASGLGFSGQAQHVVLPLSVACAGTVAGIPLVLLGNFATREWMIAALPVAATLVFVLGLTLIHAVPFLYEVLPRVRMLDALSGLAVIFLGMAAMVYPWGLWCLWRLPPPVRPPS